MEKTCIARLPSTLTRGESAEPREERGSPGPARVAAAPRRPRTRPPRASPPVRAPSWTRRSLRCPLPRVPPGRRRGVEARGWSRWSFPCSPSWPSRCGGGPEPDRLGRRDSTMNNHPGTLHGRVPDAGIPQPVPGVGGPNAAVQWQPVQAPRVARDPVARRKPKQPKLWIIFGGIGVFLLSVPDIATFLIDLRPGDHTDNGDGLYWVSGILLIVTVLPGRPLAGVIPERRPGLARGRERRARASGTMEA